MSRRLLTLIVAAAVWLGATAIAGGQPGKTAAQLSTAADALRAGDYLKAEALAAPITEQSEGVAKQDRAEAWRIYGLALYFQKRLAASERAFLSYLKLQPNAHLEPSLVPPEAIVFFESVRSKNAATLHKYRPKPETKKRWILNWLPPAGQFQNGHKVKGIIIGAVGVVALAANLTSFFLLRDWCDETTDVCKNDQGEEIRGRAKTVRQINLWSAAAIGVVYAYAVIDGLVYFRRRTTRKSVSVGVVPSASGAYVGISGHF